MKILMVLDHDFPPDIRVENEIETLTRVGHEVHIACFTMKNRAPKDNFEGATIHRKVISKLRHKTSVGCLKLPFYFNFWRGFLIDLQHTYNFDAIHIHDLPMAQLGYEMKKKFGVRFILDLHENWPALLAQADHVKGLLGKMLSNNNQWKHYEKFMCLQADEIIVVVEEAKNRLVKSNIPAQKISVVSNTLNTAHFKVPDSKPDKNYLTLFYAGGINRHRGLQTIIPALALLPNNVRLYILGDGSFVDELQSIARQNNVVDQVKFFGWQAFEKMNQLMGEADICLIPHVKSDHTDNTIPHKLFQYMYAKKPVVASNCDPIQRIIEKSASGMIYQWDDSEGFSKIIEKLLKSPEQLITMGENGYQATVKNYLWKIDAARLVKLYATNDER
ncbi:MAG: glycosyltransferase family 4 protein [Bacteroidetes bacterium]|jgi:glycosyltransferase involved in cell wall biosynthesis|nr:glycosyltransferase family 4 protein [Bacteroidota bacterium]